VFLLWVPIAFFGGNYVLLLNNKVYSTSNKLAFQVQLSFRIIADLFKNATPIVLLKCFNNPQ